MVSLTAAQQGNYTQVYRLRINPGSVVTFPWLSNIATAWENFKFRKCVLKFVPRCATTHTGAIIMSPDFDAADGQGVGISITEQSMFNNVDTIDRPIWDRGTTLVLKPERLNRLYKNHATMTDGRFAMSSQDKKTIDPCQVFICSDASTGLGATFAFGKIIVEYEVELHEPQDITDAVFSGGGAAQVTSLGTIPASPVPGVILQSQEDINSPLNFFTALNGGQPAGTVLPNCTLGMFNRDWQGTINAWMSGTGINTATDMEAWVGPNTPTVQAPSVANGDVLQYRNNYYRNPTTTLYSNLFQIVAKAGQVLKITAPLATTLSACRWTMGATSVNSL